MESKNGIVACCAGVAIIVGMVLVFTKTIPTFGATIAVVGLIVLVLSCRMIKDEENALIIKEAGCTMENGTLSISERKPEIEKVIRIVDDRDYRVSYEPEKIHVGAVSVGGVTTGGAYKTGGYHYISGSEKNGRCRLEYLGKIIRNIQLDDKLFNLAKSSSISNYLNDEKKQIQVIDPVSFTDIETHIMHNNLKSSGYMNMGSDLTKKAGQGFPTYGKCVEILDWLCCKDKKVNNIGALGTEWKCPKCGAINQWNVGTCGCGEAKPSYRH